MLHAAEERWAGLQGLVLDCSPLAWAPLNTFPKAARGGALPVWLALDEISDPVSPTDAHPLYASDEERR